MGTSNERHACTDRRRYRRFKVPNDAFCIVKKPRFKLGQIVDMSAGGLAMCYLDDRIVSDAEFAVDIMLADNGFYLSNIRVALVWDADCEFLIPDDLRYMKQCGLQFSALSAEQKAKLTYFIPQHTNGFVYDRRSNMSSFPNNIM